MKAVFFRTAIALLACCMLWPATTSAQEIVKTTIRPFEFKTLTELYANKDWKKRMSKTKKQGRYEQVIPVTLPDGNPGMLCYHKLNKYFPTLRFSLCDSLGNSKYGYLGAISANIETIDGKDYLQFVENKVTPKYILCKMNGERLHYKSCDYKVIKIGGHVLLWFSDTNTIADMDGNTIIYGGDYCSNITLHYSPEVKPEVKSITVGGQSIDMLCSATPEFLCLDGTYKDKYIKYKEVKNYEGKDVFKENTWDMIPFPSEETGYYMKFVEHPSFEIKEVNREVGGEIIPYRYLSLKDEEKICRLMNRHGEIAIDNRGIVYSSPDHSIIYRKNENGRYLKGAIFLRDSTLNVPPLFSDVMYKFDEETKAWKPYVRRSMFGPSEPYVAGMDTTPDFRNDIERKIESTGAYMYELDTFYGKDHKWSARDLAYVNYLATRRTYDSQSTYDYDPNENNWFKRSLPDLAKLGKQFGEQVRDKHFTSNYQHAQQIYESAKTDYDGEEVPALAEQLIALTEEKKREVQEWIDHQTAIYNLVFEQNEKNIQNEARLAALREQQAEMARQAAATRQQARKTDNTTNLLIMGAVMRSVNKTLGNIFGGNKPRVTYTGNGNGSYNVPTNTGGTGTSSGGAVNTSQKCGRCNGTGACSACHGHPGKATSAKNSPNCHGCGGKGRCTYCGGSGYKR